MSWFCNREPDSSSGDEVEDDDSGSLSYVAKAGYECLRVHHDKHWHQLWNVTSGKVIGEVYQTPQPYCSWNSPQDPPDEHDHWFPQKMCEILSRTQVWCDVTSLAPPDGLFLEMFKEALGNIAQTASDGRDPIIIRMMFGNIIGMPCNCDAVIEALTEDLDQDANIELWVGAWRKGVSWNHAKIIAVDGHYLHNGGHNLWDQHYLQFDPVHDLSMEAEGPVAHDGHLFANQQWTFLKEAHTTIIGRAVSLVPDNLPMLLPTRVSVSAWPEDVEPFPPMYNKKLVPQRQKMPQHMRMITLGRYGAMLGGTHADARPSDDAFVAMFDAAKKVIHMALQDLGPITLPGLAGPIAVPGCVWPKAYMSAFGRAIWERNVQVEIALSNPGSCPGGLSPTAALYGNGWTCTDVAAEIMKTIGEQFPGAHEGALKMKLESNLHICYIRQQLGNTWLDPSKSTKGHGTMGMHAKHFIIDDICYYIGSQNLYVADLAEWGILIDDTFQAMKCMREYWKPLWLHSYKGGNDYDVDKVIEGIGLDRDGEDPNLADKKMKKLMDEAHRSHMKVPHASDFHDHNDT